MDDEYYKRIEAVQFTISHDDGKIINDLEKSDVILVGPSRTSKTPTSIYLANRGYRTSNIPIIPNKNLPDQLIKSSKKTCTVGLICDSARLIDVRRNRVHSMHEDRPGNYTKEKNVIEEIKFSRTINSEQGMDKSIINSLTVAIPEEVPVIVSFNKKVSKPVLAS